MRPASCGHPHWQRSRVQARRSVHLLKLTRTWPRTSAPQEKPCRGKAGDGLGASWLSIASDGLPDVSRKSRYPGSKEPSAERPDQVPTASGACILRNIAITDSATFLPVLGFSDGMFSIESVNRALSESTSMEWQFRVTDGSA